MDRSGDFFLKASPQSLYIELSIVILDYQYVIYFDGEMRHYPADSHSGNLALCGWCPWKCKQKWGQIALYKTGSLHSYWPADAWHFPVYVYVYVQTCCPRYGIPTVGIFVCGRVRRCFWELPAPTISAKWRSRSCFHQSALLSSSPEKAVCFSSPV